MSGERKTFRLSKQVSIEIDICNGGFRVAWCPRIPGRLTFSELRRYRRARNEMLQRLARQLGGDVLVVET